MTLRVSESSTEPAIIEPRPRKDRNCTQHDDTLGILACWLRLRPPLGGPIPHSAAVAAGPARCR